MIESAGELGGISFEVQEYDDMQVVVIRMFNFKGSDNLFVVIPMSVVPGAIATLQDFLDKSQKEEQP